MNFHCESQSDSCDTVSSTIRNSKSEFHRKSEFRLFYSSPTRRLQDCPKRTISLALQEFVLTIWTVQFVTEIQRTVNVAVASQLPVYASLCGRTLELVWLTMALNCAGEIEKNWNELREQICPSKFAPTNFFCQDKKFCYRFCNTEIQATRLPDIKLLDFEQS